MASLEQWALPRLSTLLPGVDDEALRQIIGNAASLPDAEAADHFESLLGDSPQAMEFTARFNAERSRLSPYVSKADVDLKGQQQSNGSAKGEPQHSSYSADVKSSQSADEKGSQKGGGGGQSSTAAPSYAPPLYPPPSSSRIPSTDVARRRQAPRARHTNPVIRAGEIRARDEQHMQNLLQSLQYKYNIYNSEIEPEHESEYYCSCDIHQYQRAKWARVSVLDTWAQAVMYPGEKTYNDCKTNNGSQPLFSRNPYIWNVANPYGQWRSSWGPLTPRPDAHHAFITQTIRLNNQLNQQAQREIDAREPKKNIWNEEELTTTMSRLSVKGSAGDKIPVPNEKRRSVSAISNTGPSEDSSSKTSKFAKLKKSMGMKTPEEKAYDKAEKELASNRSLRDAILEEEDGRWPDDEWRRIVAAYQEKVGMTSKIAHLRNHQPIQYMHLLRAGYFEPIPVAWAGSNSNPLKFSIEAMGGWRGITPSWRGYEDTAEERLYWVLNHREGSVGMRMKPDFISEMRMANDRMAKAVEPPPEYYTDTDTCHLQHTSAGYSRQVMPAPFVAYDRPEVATDDTMILLDVSGSMDFDPMRPMYNQYLVTGWTRTTQPKNKDVAKAIIRRFSDAMANHDHQFRGYDLTTFSSQADYIGTVNHANLDALWRRIRIGGGTRVMTGWQKVKELHFQKHAASAVHHPVYGWQAGPETPMLRLLLLLDGEATDMDEFELDLLGLSWAHVTIFLIGAEGCPHHHRHANELQRISDVNHHVSFVDAQGNCPERFVTHELLKRHLGYEISMAEFTEMEELPPYTE